MFKSLKSNDYPSHRNKILQNSANHNYETRHRDLFYTPKERLEICRKSYLSKGIAFLNEYDDEVKNLKTLKFFKNAIKSSILDD